MAGKSINSLGSKNWSPGSPTTRYNVSGKSREYYTFENAPGISAYATGGTIVDGNDGYIYHIFTGDGTFQVTRPPAAIDSVEYLIVAGGGGRTPAGICGGGGGGGFRFGSISVTNTPGAYSIVVGAGGPSSPDPVSASPRNGSPSSAFGVTSTGGGGGASSGPPNPLATGASGGSGGGAGPSATSTTGGSGDTPPTAPTRQGYGGGSSTPTTGGGGGGGAGGLGSPTTPTVPGGAGGPGRIAPEFPSNIVKNAIPVPARPSWEPLIGPGGYSAGGAGSGAPAPSTRTTPANSGYGGNPAGAIGGSGIVCIRYKKTTSYQRATGGIVEPNTHPEHPGVWRHIFTSPGDFTITDPTLQWIDYLAVAGGGGGGSSPGIVFATPAPFGQGGYSTGGGGGAGGFVSSLFTAPSTPTSLAYPWNPGYSIRVGEQMPIGIGTHPITIGVGGTSDTSGTNTTIGSPGPTQIIAVGGGAGGRSSATAGQPGGSGGGAGKIYANYTGTAGGTTTPLIPSPLMQGNGGGLAPGFPSWNTSGSGGGGAGGQGSGSGGPPVAPVPTALGNGGVGWIGVLSPSSYGTPGPLAGFRYFAGGGGGGGGSIPSPTGATPPNTPLTGGSGGYGGGGAGGNSTPGQNGTNGTTNTGGGGGGGGGDNVLGTSGGTGGPGIVIIQYPE